MEVRENYSLKYLNTFGIDVSARYFVELKDDQDVIRFLGEKILERKKVPYPGRRQQHIVYRRF